MSELKRNKTDSFFFQELINRFFHSHSYFFVCLKYYLENSSVLKTDAITQNILGNLVQYLTESTNADAELKEISKIKGFDTIYNSLESQLTQINFRSLRGLQMKKAIQDLALFLLNTLSQSLIEDEKRRLALSSYLKLKVSLKQLLNETNGTSLHHNYQIAQSQDSNSLNNAIENPVPFDLHRKQLASNDHEKGKDNLTPLNFSHEADLLLKPLTGLFMQNHGPVDQSSFIEQMRIRFYKLQGLAMYTETRKVERIAERVLTLLEAMSDNQLRLNEYILELVNRAIVAIQNKTYYLQNDSSINDLCDEFDQFISSLNKQILNDAGNLDQEEPLNETALQLASVQKNPLSSDQNHTVEHHELGRTVIKTAERIGGTLDDLDSDNANHKSNFTLHNQTEDSIAGLINEIGSINTSPLPGFFTKFNKIEQSKKAVPLPDPRQTSNNGKDDNYLYSAIFSNEAEGYYKMILNALIKLKGEGNAQACLEDIELASYSIKHLARKFGMEKIAALPEIIETITYQASKRLVKLPLAIVHAIEEGISLLAIFDHQQRDHKIRFTSILSSLKQYYTKTFQAGDIISVVP